MSSGIYVAYSGAAADMSRLETIANNIANASTAGFRRNQPVFDSLLAGELPFAEPVQNRLDLSPGTQRLTGNQIQAAIDGPGFFVYLGPNGEELLTRRGDFRLSPSGVLSLPNGAPVLGTGGPLLVPEGSHPALSTDGTLRSDLGTLGKLRVVEVADTAQLVKVGESGILAGPGAGVADNPRPSLAVGFVEESNVNLAAELVNLIQAQREFEAAMRSIQINDQLSQRLTQTVGTG